MKFKTHAKASDNHNFSVWKYEAEVDEYLRRIHEETRATTAGRDDALLNCLFKEEKPKNSTAVIIIFIPPAHGITTQKLNSLSILKLLPQSFFKDPKT